MDPKERTALGELWPPRQRHDINDWLILVRNALGGFSRPGFGWLGARLRLDMAGIDMSKCRTPCDGCHGHIFQIPSETYNTSRHTIQANVDVYMGSALGVSHASHQDLREFALAGGISGPPCASSALCVDFRWLSCRKRVFVFGTTPGCPLCLSQCLTRPAQRGLALRLSATGRRLLRVPDDGAYSGGN